MLTSTFAAAEGRGHSGPKRPGGPDGRTKVGRKVGKKDPRPGGGGGGGGFNPEDHPRGEAGSPEGGQFIPKDSAGGSSSKSSGGGSSSSKEGGSKEGAAPAKEEPRMSDAKRAKELADAILDTLKDVLGQLSSKQAKALVERIQKNAKAFIAGQDGNNGGGGAKGGPTKGGAEGGAAKGGPAKGGSGAAPAKGGKGAPAKPGGPGGASDRQGGGGGLPAGAAGIIEGVKDLLKNFGDEMKDKDRKALRDAVDKMEDL
jgi:hypothetical protein